MSGLSAREMQYEAKVAYEAIASGDAPGYTDRQWSILLTQAQENIVMETLRLGYDKDELSRRILHTLIERVVIEGAEIEDVSDNDRFTENSYKVDVPENYLHIMADVANSNVKVKPVSFDFYLANIDNPFDKPFEKEYWRLVVDNGLLIVTDGDALTRYDLIYIKRPEPIITSDLLETQSIQGFHEAKDCELDPYIHREIVKETAKLAHAYSSNSAGYQIQSIESNRGRFGPMS